MASVNQIPERNLAVGHGAQNSLLAYAHRILTAATPFCSLLPPLAALANVPLYTREPLGTGDADRRNQRPKFWDKIWLAVATPQARRPCGPPRNDNGFLSFRGAERRGNPSFLRWTGVGAAESPAPTEGLPKSQQRADVGIGPYEKERKPYQPPGAALRARKEQLVKFSLCPIPSECSTAYRVRKFAKGPARVLVGAALIGQNGLEPRPAAREGAPRP